MFFGMFIQEKQVSRKRLAGESGQPVTITKFNTLQGAGPIAWFP